VRVAARPQLRQQGSKDPQTLANYYGPMPRKRGLIPAWDGVDWCLAYPDISMIEEMLDDADRNRHCEIL
jgi:hypothetical protein